MRTGPASPRRARSRVQPWEDAHRLTPAQSKTLAAAEIIHDGSFVLFSMLLSFMCAVERNSNDSEARTTYTYTTMSAWADGERLRFFLEAPEYALDTSFSALLAAV